MLPLVGFIGPFAAAVDALLEKFKHPELGFPYVFVWNLNSSLSYLLSTDTLKPPKCIKLVTKISSEILESIWDLGKFEAPRQFYAEMAREASGD